MQEDDRVAVTGLDIGDADPIDVGAACRPWSTARPPRWLDRHFRRHAPPPNPSGAERATEVFASQVAARAMASGLSPPTTKPPED
jgi:hypothetical protein